MQRLPVEDSLASAGQMALSKNGPDYDGGVIGMSSEKSDRDDPDVPVAEAGRQAVAGDCQTFLETCRSTLG